MINSNFRKSSLTPRIVTASVILVLFLLLFSTTWLNLFNQWIIFDESLSHGLFVFGLFCFWFVLALQHENWIIRKPIAWVLPILAIAINSVLWSVFQLVDIEILAIIELPILLTCLIWGLYGFRTALKLIPIISLIIFVIPIWDYLTPHLVDLSGLIVGYLVSLLGMPALIEGNSITLPRGTILIADGCSGQRYLVISITLTYIASIMNRLPTAKSVYYLVAAVLLGLLTNWIRIFSLVIIGYLSDMQSNLLADHELFGWVLFVLIVVPFLYFIPVYKKRKANERAAPSTTGQKPKSMGFVVTLLALILGPVLYVFSNNMAPNFVQESTSKLNGFTQVGSIPEGSPLLLPSNPLMLSVSKNEADLYLVAASWGRTDTQKKIVPYFTRLYDHSYWLEESTISHSLGGSHSYKTIQFKRKGYNQSWLIGYWFEVGPFHSDSYSMAKIQQIPAILLGQNRFNIHSAVIECDRLDCDQQYQVINTAFELMNLQK